MTTEIPHFKSNKLTELLELNSLRKTSTKLTDHLAVAQKRELRTLRRTIVQVNSRMEELEGQLEFIKRQDPRSIGRPTLSPTMEEKLEWGYWSTQFFGDEGTFGLDDSGSDDEDLFDAKKGIKKESDSSASPDSLKRRAESRKAEDKVETDCDSDESNSKEDWSPQGIRPYGDAAADAEQDRMRVETEKVMLKVREMALEVIRADVAAAEGAQKKPARKSKTSKKAGQK